MHIWYVTLIFKKVNYIGCPKVFAWPTGWPWEHGHFSGETRFASEKSPTRPSVNLGTPSPISVPSRPRRNRQVIPILSFFGLTVGLGIGAKNSLAWAGQFLFQGPTLMMKIACVSCKTHRFKAIPSRQWPFVLSQQLAKCLYFINACH